MSSASHRDGDGLRHVNGDAGGLRHHPAMACDLACDDTPAVLSEELLRRQGLLEGIWCLDPRETLGPGQSQEIDRVCAAYPHLNDDAFVRANLQRWLS